MAGTQRARVETTLRPGRVAAFLAIALMLYAAIFVAADLQARRMAGQNPIHRILAAEPDGLDWLILGASHAMPLDFQGFGDRIAEVTGQRALNLAVPGTGPLYHRFLAERFFATHRAAGVLVVVDSFSFRSPQWNEDRFADSGLIARMPPDRIALALYLRHLRHGIDPRAVLSYASGFARINNQDRFTPDRWEAEDSFDRSPRPSAVADRERIEYLYPQPSDPAAKARYLDHLVALIDVARAAGAEVVVIKPPIPARFAALLPDEQAFDAALTARLEAAGVEFHDFTAALPDPGYYFDPDHLNRRGAERFLDAHLAPILMRTAPAVPR